MIDIRTTTLGESGAIFSDCRNYRYELWRIWDVTKPTLTFIMLNPSTADAMINDPTVERCERRAIAGGFGRLNVVNIFAYRSTDPSKLYTLADPIGQLNNAHICEVAMRSDMVICGWGKHGALHDRGNEVIEMLLSKYIKLYALKINKDESPKHPLYVGYDAEPILMAWREKDEHKSLPKVQ